MTWLAQLGEWLKWIWPFIRPNPWERAVRITYRPADYSIHLTWPFLRKLEPWTVVKELGPGMHRRIPWVEDIAEESIVAKNYELPIQSITTKDDKSVTFGVNVTLEITDVRANLMDVHDFVESMHGTARIHLAQRTRELSWSELLDGQKDLERSLRGTLTTKLKVWGATVKDVGFTDFVHARPYRFYGEQNNIFH